MVGEAPSGSSDFAGKAQAVFGNLLPFVLKDKELMDAGVWNNARYSPQAVELIYNNTNWNIKENADLFADHQDGRTRDWIGRVTNHHYSNGKVFGDLEVYDLDMALKLALGSPRWGVSPRVKGKQIGMDVVMGSFENFSLVINPAVKTAYINNSEKGTIETSTVVDVKLQVEENKMDEEMADVPADMPASDYAFPRLKKLPIHDAAHVRNAMARFNQTIGWESGEKEEAKRRIIRAANKFGIQVGEFKNLGDEMTEKGAPPADSTNQLSEEGVKKAVGEAQIGFNKKLEEEKKVHEDALKKLEEEKKKHEEAAKKLSAEVDEMHKKLDTQAHEMTVLQEQLSAPNKVGVKGGAENSAQGQFNEDSVHAMADFIDKEFGVGIQK